MKNILFLLLIFTFIGLGGQLLMWFKAMTEANDFDKYVKIEKLLLKRTLLLTIALVIIVISLAQYG